LKEKNGTQEDNNEITKQNKVRLKSQAYRASTQLRGPNRQKI